MCRCRSANVKCFPWSFFIINVFGSDKMMSGGLVTMEKVQVLQYGTTMTLDK